MMITRAFLDGGRRVRSAPAILAGMFVLTFAITIPLQRTVEAMIAAHLGSSREAEAAADGVNYAWWQEFSSQASGLGTTFQPTILGFGAVLDNISGFLDNRTLTAPIAGAVAAYIVLWIFCSGGILDRYARQRPTRSHGFFAASGVFFFRFLRLAVVGWIVYGLLFTWVHPFLFDKAFGFLTHDMTAERNGFVLLLFPYAVFGAVLLFCNMLFDYAKVRAVVEDRRSMLGAILASARFVFRHPRKTMGLYAMNGAMFVLVVAAYWVIAPGAGGPNPWPGLLVGQIYLLARLAVKLTFMASETALFQSLLAHAEYTAAPQPVWPESPAAEAIANAQLSRQ